jgi:hypothetical protein
MDVTEYHKSVEVSKMRRLMRYGQAEFEEDWNLSIALARLMAMGDKPHFEAMLDSCFQRILAYNANEPEAVANYFIEERLGGGIDAE